MIEIFIPRVCLNEQRYILDVMLGEFLGLAFKVSEHNERDIKIIGCDDNACLSLNADFFQQAEKGWLSTESMPALPLLNWSPIENGIEVKLVEYDVPIIYGKPGLLKNDKHWHLSLDIFGSSFFMLSRYEEYVTLDRDNHARFPSWASVAHKAGFLDRPIVNEYLEILWSCIHSLWPNLQRKRRYFRKFISCDVDHPFDLASHSFKRTALRVGARLIRDKNINLAMCDLANYIFKKFHSDRFDEYHNNIDWIMRVNKALGNEVEFYFIPIQTCTSREDPNDIRTPKMLNLLKHIIDSGHKIGFHPGYNTYKFHKNFKQSADVLKEVFQKLNIEFSSIGGRQHYLRYDIGKTPQLWQDNGFSYDSSLSFADKAGFRTGACYEYTMFDVTKRIKNRLKQRPLIVMEGSIISNTYEGLGYGNEALERFSVFIERCQDFDGDFTLLWHNSFFIKPESKDFYIEILTRLNRPKRGKGDELYV